MAIAKAKTVKVQDTIGARLRDVRKRRKMTLERLSELTGISVSSLSRIENTRLGMTIEKVEKVASALGVEPETLVSRSRPGRAPSRTPGPSAGSLRFIVDRSGQREASAYRELRIEYLFDASPERSMDCMHLTVQAISIWDSEFVRHPGEKIIYVISGDAVVYSESRPPLILETGDSLYMDAAAWHSIVAVNDRVAELLVVSCPGPDSQGLPFETQFFTPESWAALQPG